MEEGDLHLQQPNQLLPPSYCPYPFSQITTTPTGHFKLCCSSSEAFGQKSDFKGEISPPIQSTSLKEYWNGSYLNWVRQQHLSGQPIKECAACLQYETNGNESYRQRAFRELGYFSEALPQPRSLDLKLGNKCNASCLFCDPSSSSRVLKEWKDLGWDQLPPFETGLTGPVTTELFEKNYSWAEEPGFWSQLIDLAPHLRNIKFTGGEPLINRYMLQFLDFLVKADYAKDMRLQVTTNAITVPQQFIDLTAKFKEVQINFSVDGYGLQNEYIRYPTKWSSWLKNVQRVIDGCGSNVELNFQHSISVYSVFGLTDLFNWMWPFKNFGFHLFKVFHPAIQRTELLEDHERERVIKELIRLISDLNKKVSCQRDERLVQEIEGIIKFIEGQESWSHLKPKLREFIIALDKHRGISIAQFMPDAAKSLKI